MYFYKFREKLGKDSLVVAYMTSLFLEDIKLDLTL